MKFNIITISREHGSGGRLIAKRLSEMLSIPLYDKQLIEMSAKDSGFTEQFIKETEQKRTTSFLYNLYFSSQNLPVNDQIFLKQSKIINEISSKKSCIIVGRCADYVLRERKDIFKVFIYAPLDERIKRITETYGETVKNPEIYLIKSDKKRSSYYNYYSDKRWGDSKNYHIMINSTIGIENAAKAIYQVIADKEDN